MCLLMIWINLQSSPLAHGESRGWSNAQSGCCAWESNLVSGTIKFAPGTGYLYQGQLIPKGSFVFGTCTLNGERLGVTFNSIRKGNSIYPVSASTYDGWSAWYPYPRQRAPGCIKGKFRKRAIQSLSIGSLDPSIGAQAASAGIEAAKTSFPERWGGKLW